VLAERLTSHARQLAPTAGPSGDPCLEFVRFCYRRRRVGWPELYDEMCAVAARGAYRGLGYVELADLGITFCLTDLPRLAALTERVLAEESHSPEPARAEAAAAGLRLSAARASG
jgi:hypothetical protein